MSRWTKKYQHRINTHQVEAFADCPSGGPVKQWLSGALIPLAILAYGINCLDRGFTTMPGRGGSAIFDGPEGVALACSYIAFGCFFHFHYFWGLHDKLHRFSETLKIVSLLAALPLFLYAMGRVFFWGWG